MSVDDRDLLAWLARALSPARALELADEVAASPELQLRARALARELDEPPPAAPRWRLPPPGMSVGPVPVRLSAESAVFGPDGDALTPEARVSVHLQDLADAEARLVVVLLRGAGEWDVIFPQAAEDRLTLAELPRDADGRRVLHLRAPPTAGTWRFGVALPPVGDVALDRDPAERWAGLRADLATGRVPVATLDVRVR